MSRNHFQNGTVSEAWSSNQASKSAPTRNEGNLGESDDRLELAKAKAENGDKPLIPWEIVAKELEFVRPKKKPSTKNRGA